MTTTPTDTRPEKVRLMLQNLPTERFKLAVHKEMKPPPAFALVARNSKPKLKESEGSETRTAFTGSISGLPTRVWRMWMRLQEFRLS
jgi:uncharacterized protein (TIGR03435 family)